MRPDPAGAAAGWLATAAVTVGHGPGGTALLPVLAAAALAGALVCLLPARPRGQRARLESAAAGGRSGTTDTRGGLSRPKPGASLRALIPSLIVGAVLVGGCLALLLVLPGGTRLGAGLDRYGPAALLSAVAARLVQLGLPGAAPAAVLAIVVATRARRRTRRAKARIRVRRAVIDGVLVLASELRAGTPALPALQAAAVAVPQLGPPAGVALLGGDVADAFRTAGRAPGAGGLCWLAAAWTVSAEMGAALADTVEELVEILRAEDRAREETESALAATRATARLLCLLPLAGLGLGAGVGAHPWSRLTQTSWGPALLAVATLLAGAGLEWVERLAASAEEPGVTGGSG